MNQSVPLETAIPRRSRGGGGHKFGLTNYVDEVNSMASVRGISSCRLENV